MYKVIQVIQDLPLDEDNPLRGRHFLLFDEKKKRKVDLRPLAYKDQYSFVYENQMFDIYGREMKIDPSITEIGERVGRWRAFNTDVETYLVKKSDGRNYIAYVEYYRGDRSNVTYWLSELNPAFDDKSQLKVALICSDFEIIDTCPFSEQSAIVQYYGDSDHRLWLAEMPCGEKRMFFLLHPDFTRIINLDIFEKDMSEYPFSLNRKCFTFSYNKSGEITISVKTGRGEHIIAKTDDVFITTIQETGRAHIYTIPFYLVSKKGS